jgi:TonB family protein
VYLFSGADGTLLSTWSGEAVKDNFGGTVAGGHDVDGDDIPDIAIGAVGNDDGGVDAGKVYVYSGRDAGLIQSFAGRSGVTALDTARVARVIEAERAIHKAADTLSLPETIYDSTQVDVMPILRRSVSAEYPSTALGSDLSGWVKVRILVLADGAPGKVDIEDDAGLGPDFRLAALTAARQWFFLPATLGGEPVAAWTLIPIGFAPEEARQPTPKDTSGTGPGTEADSLGRATSDSGAGEMAVPSGADTLQGTAVPLDSSSLEPSPAELPGSLAGSTGGTESSGIDTISSAPAADAEGEAAAPEASGVEVDPARLYEITDVDVPPVLVARVEPQYPAAARLAGDTATVVMRILVDTLGAVGRMEMKTCTLPGKGFEEAATSAVRKWHFEPARRASSKVMCWVEYALEFRL